ncbi:replication initiation factor domain-containing protein [Lacticaseibacillus rhamnosus]|uniref:replication initiation factor domain-containing protein n=1 Tax=Lacticaseibacillus rhamnosus TaxID=47715 RepID=UPI003749B770
MCSWHEKIKTKRKQLKLTQVQLARRLGVTRMHYVQVENGKTNPSPALQAEIDRLLKNWNDEPELTLMFDYMRVRFPTTDAKAVITKILGLTPEHLIFEEHGFYGYSAMYIFSNIQVMVAPIDSNLGTLVEMKGQGCREFEGILLSHGETWYDYFLRVDEAGGIFKRVDIAINDMVGLLNIPELVDKCLNNECISVMRSFQGLQSGKLVDLDKAGRGNTLYVGTMKSDVYFCIYEKAAEQAAKRGIAIADTPIINRFEIRLKNERAIKVIESMLITRDAEKVAFGIITRYMRFVDEVPDKSRLKWPLNDRWAYFLGKGRQPIRLTTAPQPFDMNKTKAWLQKQVMPTLKVIKEIDNYFGTTDLQLMIKDAELNDKHLKLIEQQTVGSEELGGDMFGQ